MGETLRIVIPYSPRPQFHDFHESLKRFAVGVAHRRAGKTVASINKLIRGALTCERPDPRFAYLAPFFNQAKDVAWEYLKHYSAPVPGVGFNESELRVDFPNGGRVRLYGADNADRLRGIYLDGVVLDEYAQMHPRAWAEIIRPALTDRQGWALFIGTPMGRNAFSEIYEAAKLDPEWMTFCLRASETGLIPAPELEAARKAMSEDQYAQEFECSFDAAIMGSYYGKLIGDAEPRMVRTLYDPALPVTTAWDLGIGDSTAIWFCQQVGNEVRLIDYYENAGEGMGHYAKVILGKPYTYKEHIGPHDAAARLQDEHGRTRVEILHSLGIRMRVLANSSTDDGIEAVRVLLPRCWFDRDKCARGIEALRQYRREYDDKLKTFRSKPLHDWTSHPADAFRYLAVGLRAEREKRPGRPVGAAGGWMG